MGVPDRDGCLLFILASILCSMAIGVGCWELSKYVIHHLQLAWN